MTHACSGRGWVALVGVVVWLGAASPTAAAQLKITVPVDNARVSGKVIEVSGVGADPKAQLEVSVLTNEWYVQNGKAVINADGSWTYSPVYVSGQAEFNNHTIRVTIISAGKRGASASVKGVVRRD